MRYLIPFTEVHQAAGGQVGNKALTLARLHQSGFAVPDGFCLPVEAYCEFLERTGLAVFIAMELQRKDFAQMRWEEIWDVSLRIRNHFVSVKWPASLKQAMLTDLRRIPDAWEAVAVRSTSPLEDSRRQSFAGLHESRVMLREANEILEAIRVVWSSLWSDGALLYRRELGLDPAESAMAVIIQQMVVGERSGVLFTRAPIDSSRMMVEAVWGLNQALVDGTVEPDCWLLNRAQGTVFEKHEVHRTETLRPTERGTALVPLDAQKRRTSPLDEPLCRELVRIGLKIEEQLGSAVDIEWTICKEVLHILQARPITAARTPQTGDERPWYLSLHRSLPNLERLRDELENHILPGMALEAEEMAATDPANMDDESLACEIERRRKMLNKWLSIYKEKCIPMAHGIRLFGEFYNEFVHPEDPYAFLDLLHSDDLIAVKRNRRLMAMARLARDDPALLEGLKQGQGIPDTGPLRQMYNEFRQSFEHVNWISHGEIDLTAWLVKLATEPEAKNSEIERVKMGENAFFNRLPQKERVLAHRLLTVARASYTLRDNDNIYLDKVRSEVLIAEHEGRRRLASKTSDTLRQILSEEAGREGLFAPAKSEGPKEADQAAPPQMARQLVGQPAGPGVDTGEARVLLGSSDLHAFRSGEILVCDAIDPNMTFLVPLAAAIVERRGGMLIHGAIIAREYGIPCVTGIPDATNLIHTGDRVTVDGYLGIVTIDHREE